MSNEMRAKVERMMRSCQATIRDHPHGNLSFELDAVAVFEPWLAEHPADDAEPVTLTAAEDVFAPLDATVSQLAGVVWVTFEATVPVRTLGDLRRLGRALGADEPARGGRAATGG